MSYEHCERHDLDSTNGCRDCHGELEDAADRLSAVAGELAKTVVEFRGREGAVLFDEGIVLGSLTMRAQLLEDLAAGLRADAKALSELAAKRVAERPAS